MNELKSFNCMHMDFVVKMLEHVYCNYRDKTSHVIFRKSS